MLQDYLIDAALRFRDTELWNTVDDSMLFAVSLSCGDTGYCCVMGANGEHYALGMYKGTEGLNSYFSTLSMNNASISNIMIKKLMFNHINCDFVNASQMDFPECASEIRTYAKSKGMKVRRSHGHPDFVRYFPIKAEHPIEAEEDQLWAAECLQGATALAAKLKTCTPEELGFDAKRECPLPRDGKSIPLVEKNADGEYYFSQMNIPAVMEPKLPRVEYDNDFSSLKFKQAEHHPDFVAQCKIMPMPCNDTSENGGISFILFSICRDKDGYQFPPVMGENYPDKCVEPLTQWGENILECTNYMPSAVEVSDPITESLMAEFCKKTNIKLRVIDDKHLGMDDLESQFFSMMLSNDFDIDEDED